MASASDLARSAVDKLVREHHAAFLLELFGPASGMSEEELAALIASGVLDPEDIERVLVPGSRHDLDPFLFLRLAGRIVAEEAGDARAQMRDWSLDRWVAAVDKRVDTMMAGTAQPPGGIVVRSPVEAPAVPHDPPSQIPTDPQTPPWLPRAEALAYTQARTRAGAYARGLGNIVRTSLGSALRESWSGEDIIAEVSPEKRAQALETIQDLTAEAIVSHRDSGKLGRDLAAATGDYAHNWEMIARTELQGTYNDGQVMAGIEDYGPDTLIARFPESGACDQCREHFTGPDGRPRVFPVEELLGNGTNVGKRRTAWLPTIWPMHPNCRCDTVVVPPGYFVTRDGRLREEK